MGKVSEEEGLMGVTVGKYSDGSYNVTGVFGGLAGARLCPSLVVSVCSNCFSAVFLIRGNRGAGRV